MKLIIDTEVLDSGVHTATVNSTSETNFIFTDRFRGYGRTAMSAILDMVEEFAQYESDVELFAEHGDNIK